MSLRPCPCVFVPRAHVSVFVTAQVRLSDDLRQAVALDLKNQKDGQKADSVLNHILKNTMADAIGCIELFCQQHRGVDREERLTKASDILFRGMWWCKLREAMLSLVSGSYETMLTATALHPFAQDFVRGRKVDLVCAEATVELDPTVCSIVLDNAITNAIRHGCPCDPNVRLKVEVADARARTQSMQDVAACESSTSGPEDGTQVMPEDLPVDVRFTVINKANPNRMPLPFEWSSEGDSPSLKVGSRPTLSDGLGLQHISMVAKAGGMPGAGGAARGFVSCCCWFA